MKLGSTNSPIHRLDPTWVTNIPYLAIYIYTYHVVKTIVNHPRLGMVQKPPIYKNGDDWGMADVFFVDPPLTIHHY